LSGILSSEAEYGDCSPFLNWLLVLSSGNELMVTMLVLFLPK
jgi:hypothetical protein